MRLNLPAYKLTPGLGLRLFSYRLGGNDGVFSFIAGRQAEHG